MNATAPRVLDLTRLLTRVGRGPPTGIDRVEMAYLDRFLADEAPAWFLAATRRRLLLLDAGGARAFRDRLAGAAPWGRPDLVARLTRRLHPERRLAEASLRRDAVVSAPRGRPERLVAALPAGGRYFNTGHANIDARLLAALGRAGLSRHVLIHDTIPLDHPGFASPGSAARFGAMLAAVAAGADRVIHISQAARAATERHLAALDRVPPGLVAPLGVDLAAPDPGMQRPGAPYFVALGTIEPRKNLGLLLDAWEILARDPPRDPPPGGLPRLMILGSRGWGPAELFRRLDALPAAGPVAERAGLKDGQVAALVAGAAGVLMPSRAEGYGLPPIEAAARGVPVVVAPLPVYDQTLGPAALRADPDDPAAWADAVRKLCRADAPKPRLAPPDWAAHFDQVLVRSAEADQP